MSASVPAARPDLVLGVGASSGCRSAELGALVRRALREIDSDVGLVACVATATIKADEPAILALVAALAVPLRTHDATELAAVDVPSPSPVVARAVGTPSVAEAAALLSAGPGGELLVPKCRSAAATCAVARSTVP